MNRYLSKQNYDLIPTVHSTKLLIHPRLPGPPGTNRIECQIIPEEIAISDSPG